MSKRSIVSLFFEPKSIAIVGSLSQEWFGGLAIYNNLKKLGYNGKIYLVNPAYNEIYGIKVYPSLTNIKDDIDLAIIITPAKIVPSIIKDCIKKGIKAVIIGSDGFADIGDEGKKLQDEVVEMAKEEGVRILGPNTVGVINTSNNFTTTTYRLEYNAFRRGGISIIGQTGMVGPQAYPYHELKFGISKVCDLGNKCDVDESDIIEYLGEDEDTKVIVLHIESIMDGRKFKRVVEKVIKKKPILVLKAGKTVESARAILSHTGALAGNYVLHHNIFKQLGLIEVNNLHEMIEIAKAFVSQPLPKGNNLAIITPAGGMGALTIDYAIASGLRLARFSQKTIKKLIKIHPAIAKNPIDLGYTFVRGIFPFRDVITALNEDANVDCIFCIIWTPLWKLDKSYRETLREFKDKLSKPITFWVYGMDNKVIGKVRSEIEEAGYPVYLNIETAINALAALCKYSKIKTTK